MVDFFPVEPMWARHELASTYDVVIIGAGVHGLATAYYLACQGVRSVAVLERNYLGYGNSGRNTAIIRCNYRTPEGIPFYHESVRLYEELSGVLGFNVLFSQQGHLTLAHSDAAVNGLCVRAEANQALGVNSSLIGPKEIKELVPDIDITDRPRFPIMAALYHPPGGIIRHDAVVWGYAREASRLGVQVHPRTEVLGIERSNGRIASVQTNRGAIHTHTVVNATSGWSTTISRMAGVELPIVSHPLQACVSESLKPFLNKVIVSANLHVYVNQTARGEVVMGAEIDPYQTYQMASTLPTLEMIAGHTLELFPRLQHARVLRQWAGICDMTPDYSPIISGVPELNGYYLDVGWGTYGFKAGPAAGKNLASLIATGKVPELIRPFGYTRFLEGKLLGEKAAAAVSS
ncbi:MAG TPA: FAD-dependent oxidoreductase [Candidatus Acidoferrales bacterium]|nr:FAD-dependent oxidoreductase [Candidatus Acidoferrales bacterium]